MVGVRKVPPDKGPPDKVTSLQARNLCYSAQSHATIGYLKYKPVLYFVLLVISLALNYHLTHNLNFYCFCSHNNYLDTRCIPF